MIIKVSNIFSAFSFFARMCKLLANLSDWMKVHQKGWKKLFFLKCVSTQQETHWQRNGCCFVVVVAAATVVAHGEGYNSFSDVIASINKKGTELLSSSKIYLLSNISLQYLLKFIFKLEYLFLVILRLVLWLKSIY